jgi:hypothetical protein
MSKSVIVPKCAKLRSSSHFSTAIPFALDETDCFETRTVSFDVAQLTTLPRRGRAAF